MDRDKRLYFVLTAVIRLSLIVAVAGAVWERAWITLFVSALSLALTFMPLIIQRTYEISLPGEIQIMIVLFVYAALFLGMAREWYYRFWWWDSLMHGSAGVALGFAGFLILYVLHRSGKLQASPLLIVLFSFCFAVALGALWEIIEFAVDSFTGADMQRTPTLPQVIEHGSARLAIYDTMRDLILDSLGALIASACGYIYLKRGEIFLFDRLIKNFEDINPELFEEKDRQKPR